MCDYSTVPLRSCSERLRQYQYRQTREKQLRSDVQKGEIKEMRESQLRMNELLSKVIVDGAK